MSPPWAAVLLCLSLFAAEPSAAKPRVSGDVAILRDGKSLIGEVVEPTPRGMLIFSMNVRRAWVKTHLPGWYDRWKAIEAPWTLRALAQRKERLTAWRKERSASVTNAEDRILAWIDHELEKLNRGNAEESPLMRIRLGRGDLTSIHRADKLQIKSLQLAWQARLPDPESMRVDDLNSALEGRGYDLSAANSVGIDALLPPQAESEGTWLIRRAATEVSIDPGLRFIRYQGLLVPELERGQPLNVGTALSALSGLKGMLEDTPTDPLQARLREVAARGRVGAVVTQLDMDADLSSVAVVMTLWVRQAADRWTPAGSRTARIRTDAQGADAGKDLAADPQVAMAFQVVEALGLGTITPELKRRSLNVGDATQRALAQARTLADADLTQLMLPVLSAQPAP